MRALLRRIEALAGMCLPRPVSWLFTTMPTAFYPHSMLACPVPLGTTNSSITVHPPLAAPTVLVSLNTGSSDLWMRTYLSEAPGSGSLSNPYETLSRVNSLLSSSLSGSKVEFAMRPEGVVQLVNNTTGSYSLDLDAEVARLLGYADSAYTVTVSSQGTTAATYHPAGTLFFLSRTNDKGWTATAAHVAASDASDGVVTAYTDMAQTFLRSFDINWLPYDADVASSVNEWTSPMWPLTTGNAAAHWRMPTQDLSNTGVCPPSVHAVLSYGVGKEFGLALGNFQATILGTSSVDLGYLSSTGINQRKTTFSIPLSKQRINHGPLIFTRTSGISV